MSIDDYHVKMVLQKNIQFKLNFKVSGQKQSLAYLRLIFG